jgi:chemotaxis protein histidine kinase CheA
MGGVGVLVDGWEGYSEVLVRTLGRHASRWRGISGASELPDGSIALVLDLPRLLEMHI